MIREALAGKRVLLTGATGFLGSALLERLVVDVPVARVDVLVRGDPRERLVSLGFGSVFSAARSRLGGRLDELLGEKVRALSGDVAERLEIAPDVDLVVHCAATVSFDAPIDKAFRTNLEGTVALYEAARPRPFVHVSTAYVAAVIDLGVMTSDLFVAVNAQKEALRLAPGSSLYAANLTRLLTAPYAKRRRIRLHAPRTSDAAPHRHSGRAPNGERDV
ncbi:MAG: SDR family oxidoreductase [Candidatus Binatia bacterium]